MMPQRFLALFAQTAGAILDDCAVDLRHTRGWRAGPRREWEDMQLREPTRIDQVERSSEHVFVFGRKPRDDICAETHIGAKASHLLEKSNRVTARVPALHALENEIITRLQRQVQMRHQTRFLAQCVEQG